MNRFEVIQFLKSFFTEIKTPGGDSSVSIKIMEPFNKLVLSLKMNLPMPIALLRELAALGTGTDLSETNTSLLYGRINRCYLRLRRTQEELGRIDLGKAGPGVSPEDYIFSRIDFSRYLAMSGKDFNALFPAGLTDFNEEFYKKNFSYTRNELQALIEGSYKKTDEVYRIGKDNLLILSVMRTLDTSLESAALISAGEVEQELKNLFNFLGRDMRIPDLELFYAHLISCFDGKSILHEDGMTTDLFISPQGDLSGTFRPDNKPWTQILIPKIIKQQ